MKIKQRKLFVFLTIHFSLLAIFILMIFFAKEQLSVLGTIIIIMMVTNGVIYIGGNVWKAWVKSKYFQPGLVESYEK
jgi:Ca2+/Na+ antiporter